MSLISDDQVILALPEFKKDLEKRIGFLSNFIDNSVIGN